MNDESQNLVLKHLQAFRDDLASFAKKLDANTGSVSLMADGIISLRGEVTSLKNEVQILTLSVSGHAERLANVEHRLERIEHHFENETPQH